MLAAMHLFNMNNFLKKVVAVSVMLLAFIQALAYDFSVNGFYYNFIRNYPNDVEITYRSGYWSDPESNSYAAPITQIPSTVKQWNGTTYTISRIGEYAFFGCSQMESLTIPRSVVEIEKNAFFGCTSLKELIFESFGEPEVIYYPDWTSTNHEDNSESSYEYMIPFYPRNKFLFDYWTDCESNDYLCGYSLENGEVVIQIVKATGMDKSGTFTSTNNSGIGDRHSYLFKFVKNGEKSEGRDQAGVCNVRLVRTGTLMFDEGYDGSRFSSCPLDTVFIGRNLFYSTPFAGNKTLRTVATSEEVTNIRAGEFSGCSNLQRFEMGAGVENVEENAFKDCGALRTLICHAAVPPLCKDMALDGIDKSACKLHVPFESLDLYRNAPQWKEFFAIEGFSNIQDQRIVNGFDVKISEGHISLVGADNATVEIFAVDGSLVSRTNDYYGQEISLSKGFYVVRANNCSRKIFMM